MKKYKCLILGASGFIGRNVYETLKKSDRYEVVGTTTTYHLPWTRDLVRVDLTDKYEVERVLEDDYDVVIQAAAVTSGSKDIIENPALHVTDNAVMNSLLLREVYKRKVPHFIFFSCSVMYPKTNLCIACNKGQDEGLHIRGVTHPFIPYGWGKRMEKHFYPEAVSEEYFGVGWTKVYIEKMCEFYSKLGRTKHTVIRHSNIYGPYDKFDLEKSHVFGATMTKVLQSRGKVTVWGEGREERDFLYVDDLVRFVGLAIEKQTTPFELVNVGSGEAVSVDNLVKKIIAISKKKCKIFYDTLKPTIPTRIILDCQKAKKLFGWEPEVSLDQGIRKTLKWYQREYEKI